MPTIMTHAVSAAALTSAFPARCVPRRLIVLGAICAMVPDVDVFGFRFGIFYGALWGHRGLTPLAGLCFLLERYCVVRGASLCRRVDAASRLLALSFSRHRFAWDIGCVYRWGLRCGVLFAIRQYSLLFPISSYRSLPDWRTLFFRARPVRVLQRACLGLVALHCFCHHSFCSSSRVYRPEQV